MTYVLADDSARSNGGRDPMADRPTVETPPVTTDIDQIVDACRGAIAADRGGAELGRQVLAILGVAE